MILLLDVVTGWILFASLALCTGVVLGRWVILLHVGGDSTVPGEDLRMVAARVGGRATLLLWASLVLVFARQLLEFRDPFVPWISDARLLLGGTDWGATWTSAILVALMAHVGFRLVLRGRGVGWWVATLAVLALGAFPALTGHANAGEPRGLTLMVDTLHVWAAGGWIGGLALLIFLEVRQRREQGPAARSLLPALVPGFSRLAMGCVAALVATGTFASWVHLESVSAVVGTPYGRLLLLKLALVAGVLAFGAVNLKRITPRLREPTGHAAMVRAAALELALACAVFAVTAILVRTSPP